MKFVFALIAAIALVHAASAADGAWARADIFMLNPIANGLIGANSYALFTKINETHTSIHVHIEGIPAGLNPNAEHGVHIHTYGDMADLSGTALGGHWNWNNVSHGCGEARSAGDLGNFTAVGGTIDDERVYDLVYLTGSNSVVGRAIVLHANPDDCHNVASSGPRIAAGVIGIQNVTGAGNVNFAAVGDFGTGALSATCVVHPTSTYGTPDFFGVFSWNQTSEGAPTAVNGFLNKNLTVGVHVHKFGDLSDRAAAQAVASHFDPLLTNTHALPSSPSAHHAGDMGNTDPANFDGTYLTYEATFNYQTLYGGNSVIGHGFIVHTKNDDGTGSTGNAGNRQGQCVIGLAATPVVVPVAAPEAPTAPEAPIAPVPTVVPSSASSLALSLTLVAFLAAFGLFI